VKLPAVVAAPFKVAVIVFAAKLPDASLLTIVEGVLTFVAEFARAAPEATLVALDPPTEATTVEDCVPVTSPDSEPEKFVAEVALPERVAVMMPAAKLPEASLLTIVEGVFEPVAAFARVAPEATLEALDPPTEVTTVADCVPVTSPAREPEKLVVEEAFPIKFAVMVPAEKLPDASLLTRVEGVLEDVPAFAAIAPEATVDAEAPPTEDTTVADWVPRTSPISDPVKEVALVALPVSGPTKLVAPIVPAEKPPEPSRRTIVPAFERDVEALARVLPDATLDAPTPPTVETTVADWVPVTSPLREPPKLVAEVALPRKLLAVTLLAEKLPVPSRRTIAFGVTAGVEADARVEPVATVLAEAPPT
jgi:hypothetical protein